MRPALIPPLVLLLAACSAPPPAAEPPPETVSPFDDCAALAASPPSAAPETSSRGAGNLPELSLPCFTGGRPVALTDLRGPAVINMWASWCGPCREELPVVQRLAERAEGRLHVIGVDVGDSREAAASFGQARGVTFPTLYDRDRKLLAALGKVTLPVTVFVDTAGRGYVHPLPVDARKLSELVRTHTGVTVTP
ncbi:TlpA disulfide reductase family protein [Actinoplanes sp. NPDC051633]|uniref:TlpA family protein disulfide reductase n=1 Tax=Actinoplanes sp. NPDC051633 TaxID=3155670 RepID=UPI003430CA80